MRITVKTRLREEQYMQLSEYAARVGESMTAIMNKAINEYIIMRTGAKRCIEIGKVKEVCDFLDTTIEDLYKVYGILPNEA